MSSTERVRRAITFGQPDRVPIVFWNRDQAEGDVMLYHLSLGLDRKADTAANLWDWSLNEWGYRLESMGDGTMGHPVEPFWKELPAPGEVHAPPLRADERMAPAAAFFQAVIAARPHPEQGFRTCLGILSLTRSYDTARVDAACRRGILIKARSVASIRSILKNGLDRAFLDETPDHQPLRHGNIRGQGYFH